MGTSRDKIKKIIRMYGLTPQKSKGQHFLLDSSIVESMVEAAEVSNMDTVIEIGPGLGILTEELVRRAGVVYGVEIDRVALQFLRDKFAGVKKITFFEEDIISSATVGSITVPYKVIANIPYNITSQIIKKFLTSKNQPKCMVLMVQKEVAERICAASGAMSLLALSVQLYSTPQYIATVDKHFFWPIPEVDSAIIRFTDICDASRHLGTLSEKHFWQVARIGFSAKRKLLANNLAAGFQIEKKVFVDLLSNLTISVTARPQELTLEQWISLAKNIEMFRN